jgi:GntR family transcriptional regulator
MVPPKYLRVLNTLRERIEAGAYAPGASLPSESQLGAEFGVSRPTVLRALAILRQDGWIESRQGIGHFVRGRLPMGRHLPGYVADAFHLDETVQTEILHVGPVLATARVATMLGIEEGTPVYERRRRTIAESGPLDLVTVYVPVEIAVGTDITKKAPISGDLAEHVDKRKDVRGDYATETLTARRPSKDEITLLQLDKDDAVLVIWLGLYQSSGEAVMAAQLVLPGSRHEIEDSFPIH